MQSPSQVQEPHGKEKLRVGRLLRRQDRNEPPMCSFPEHGEAVMQSDDTNGGLFSRDRFQGRIGQSLSRIKFVLIDAVLINLGFLISFLIRYGTPYPEYTFPSYKSSEVFLTVIFIGALSYFGVYKSRFRSSWDLYKRVSRGMFIGTLLSVSFIYVFRTSWGSFPTTVFTLAFFVNMGLVFAVKRRLLKARKRIKKNVVIIGEGDIDDVVLEKAIVEKRKIDEIEELVKYADIDEIVICEKIQKERDLNLLMYLVHKLKIDVFFSPSCYMGLLNETINGGNSFHFFATFFGKRSDSEEFSMRMLDVAGSLSLLFLSFPLMILASILIKLTSPGPVLYKQQRIGKDGKVFTLYKFRTMVKDAEKIFGPVWATRDDQRVTSFGRILRQTRFDEIPQLLNVLKGQMSLVGPRPERPHFVKQHKALRELRLAVKPGITGLAQIRNFYDLNPDRKIKYDYLYIQRRSFLLNVYILAKTIPIVLYRKGW